MARQVTTLRYTTTPINRDGRPALSTAATTSAAPPANNAAIRSRVAALTATVTGLPLRAGHGDLAVIRVAPETLSCDVRARSRP